MTAYVAEGWWHPNVKGGQVHDHPTAPGRGWSAASHRLCEQVYTARAPDPLDEYPARGTPSWRCADCEATPLWRGLWNELRYMLRRHRERTWQARQRQVGDTKP